MKTLTPIVFELYKNTYAGGVDSTPPPPGLIGLREFILAVMTYVSIVRGALRHRNTGISGVAQWGRSGSGSGSG